MLKLTDLMLQLIKVLIDKDDRVRDGLDERGAEPGSKINGSNQRVRSVVEHVSDLTSVLGKRQNLKNILKIRKSRECLGFRYLDINVLRSGPSYLLFI